MCPNMLTWPDYPECFGENYNHETVARIKEEGATKWLCSLPMFEYAYVLIMDAIEKYGGRVAPYIEELFSERMLPILNEYHKKLIEYRAFRMIHMRCYNSHHKIISDGGLRQKYHELQMLTKKTRVSLRGEIFKWVEEHPRPPHQDIVVN